MKTPWGESTDLRSRKMPPGRGTPRDEADRNHRERLFAATVALVNEKGYEATRIADLVKLSGISRSAFYRQFADKQECFLTAAEELTRPTLELMERAERAPTGEERLVEALEAFLQLMADQPAAAKMCFVDIYAAGPEGVAVVDGTLDCVPGIRDGPLRAGSEPGGDAAADGAGDDRRPPEGRPQAPLSR